MTPAPDNREQEIARALRQLGLDHQEGRLSMASYRRLRRSLLEMADKGEEILPLVSRNAARRVRPGIVVWLAGLAIVLLLVTLGWLLR